MIKGCTHVDIPYTNIEVNILKIKYLIIQFNV